MTFLAHVISLIQLRKKRTSMFHKDGTLKREGYYFIQKEMGKNNSLSK